MSKSQFALGTIILWLKFLTLFHADFSNFSMFFKIHLSYLINEKWFLITALNLALKFSFIQQKTLCKNNFWCPSSQLIFESVGEGNQVRTSNKPLPLTYAVTNPWLLKYAPQVTGSCTSFTAMPPWLEAAHSLPKLTWTCLATGCSC